MKTWKKIEETKKRTNEISHLKKRNEEKVQKVISYANLILPILESDRHLIQSGEYKDEFPAKLYDLEAKAGGKA